MSDESRVNRVKHSSGNPIVGADDRVSAGDSHLPVSDLGLSLTELGETYANLLNEGNDPYHPAPVTPDELGRTVDELVSEPGSSSLAAPRTDDEIAPLAILEAMLFVGHPDNRPLESSHVASLMRGVSASDIDEWIGKLNDEYRSSQSPYRIESAGSGYRLSLRQEFLSIADVFLGKVREARLAQSAIDVLAIVAYNQPIKRQDVDALRGNSSSAVLAQLIRRDLLRIERSDSERQQILYRTTDRFLDLFGLGSLEELPKSHDLERS